MDVLGRDGVAYGALTVRALAVRVSDVRAGVVVDARHSASRDAALCSGGIGLGESTSPPFPFPFTADLVPVDSARRRGAEDGLSALCALVAGRLVLPNTSPFASSLFGVPLLLCAPPVRSPSPSRG